MRLGRCPSLAARAPPLFFGGCDSYLHGSAPWPSGFALSIFWLAALRGRRERCSAAGRSACDDPQNGIQRKEPLDLPHKPLGGGVGTVGQVHEVPKEVGGQAAAQDHEFKNLDRNGGPVRLFPKRSGAWSLPRASFRFDVGAVTVDDVGVTAQLGPAQPLP